MTRRAAADRVRHVGAEGDAGQAVARDRLLLDVDRLAVCVVRPTWIAHDDRAGPIRLPVTSPSVASMNTSSRSVWKLYET